MNKLQYQRFINVTVDASQVKPNEATVCCHYFFNLRCGDYDTKAIDYIDGEMHGTTVNGANQRIAHYVRRNRAKYPPYDNRNILSSCLSFVESMYP